MVKNVVFHFVRMWQALANPVTNVYLTMYWSGMDSDIHNMAYICRQCQY